MDTSKIVETLNSVHDYIKSLKEKNAKLVEENKVLNVQAHESEKMITPLTNTCNTLQEKVKDLEKMIEEKDAEIERLKSQLANQSEGESEIEKAIARVRDLVDSE